MADITSIHDYALVKELKQDYLMEVRYHTNKLISDSRKLHKVRKSIPFPFKKCLLRRLENTVDSDKFTVSVFTRLYGECNVNYIK